MHQLSCKGFEFKDFYIPPFSIEEGDLLGVMLGNSAYSSVLKNRFVEFFNDDHNYSDPKLKLGLADHFYEKEILGFKKYVPTIVSTYIKRNANKESKFATRIYEIDYIKPSSKVTSLQVLHRRLLTLSAYMSKSKYFIFDTAGLDNQETIFILNFVKEFLANEGGIAVWMDYFGRFKNICKKYVIVLKNNEEINAQKSNFNFFE